MNHDSPSAPDTINVLVVEPGRKSYPKAIRRDESEVR